MYIHKFLKVSLFTEFNLVNVLNFRQVTKLDCFTSYKKCIEFFYRLLLAEMFGKRPRITSKNFFTSCKKFC